MNDVQQTAHTLTLTGKSRLQIKYKRASQWPVRSLVSTLLVVLKLLLYTSNTSVTCSSCCEWQIFTHTSHLGKQQSWIPFSDLTVGFLMWCVLAVSHGYQDAYWTERRKAKRKDSCKAAAFWLQHHHWRRCIVTCRFRAAMSWFIDGISLLAGFPGWSADKVKGLYYVCRSSISQQTEEDGEFWGFFWSVLSGSRVITKTCFM